MYTNKDVYLFISILVIMKHNYITSFMSRTRAVWLENNMRFQKNYSFLLDKKKLWLLAHNENKKTSLIRRQNLLQK